MQLHIVLTASVLLSPAVIRIMKTPVRGYVFYFQRTFSPCQLLVLYHCASSVAAAQLTNGGPWAKCQRAQLCV